MSEGFVFVLSLQAFIVPLEQLLHHHRPFWCCLFVSGINNFQFRHREQKCQLTHKRTVIVIIEEL
jgi:hypothetical protein